MNLENIVTNLELSKRLKELNLPQESLFYWTKYPDKTIPRYWESIIHINETNKICSAFTSAELGLILPKGFMQFKKERGWMFSIDTTPESWWGARRIFEIENESEANTRARMLISLIENNLLKL